MVMKKRCLLLLLILMAAPIAAFAHEGEEHATAAEAAFHLWNPLWVLFAAAVITAFALFISTIFINKINNDSSKKIFFLIIVAVIGLGTLYLAFYTIYTNVTSQTRGPVHWHADFEILVCGEKIELPVSKGVSNKVGTPLFHHHNDYRIHIEGVVENLSDVDLGAFFETIGGKFTQDSLGVPKDDGSMESWRNGDLCPDGHPGTLKLFVNGRQNADISEYVIAPYSEVPPGD